MSQISAAIKANDPVTVERLIAQGADIHARDAEGNTPLMETLGRDRSPALFHILLEHGARVNDANEYGGTPLMAAVLWKRMGLISVLLEKGAQVDVVGRLEKSMAYMTPLTMAALDGSMDIVKALLDAGADVNLPDGEGRTAVHLAAPAPPTDTEKLEVLHLLIARGAGVNGRTRYTMRTPLMEACRWPTAAAAAVKALLDAGAEVNAEDREGNTAVLFALQRGMGEVSEEIVSLLVAHGARVDIANQQGDTPLLLAQKGKHQDAVRILRKAQPAIHAVDRHGNTILHNAIIHRLGWDPVCCYLNGKGDINVRNGEGMTPLMLCARTGWTELASRLVKGGADIDARDNDGNTALLHAAQQPDPSEETILMRLDAHADPNTKSNRGETALLSAAGAGYRCLPIVKRLLAAGGKPNEASGNGVTPLMRAVENTDADMVRLLLSAGADPAQTNAEGLSAIDIAKAMHTSASEPTREGDDFERDVVGKRGEIVRILSA